jgi:predicted nucleotidyltransferase
MSDAPEEALADIARRLRARGIAFALVGGLGVSVRAEVRFTRDVDLAIAVADDSSLEALVRDLRAGGYETVAVVEHEVRQRLATVRLQSSSGVPIGLIAGSCGIEDDVVARATLVDFPGAGAVPVATPEDLLAMKVLAMTDQRLQDRLDAMSLVLTNPNLDLGAVRDALRLITERGYHRDQHLPDKLAAVLAEAGRAVS